MSFPQAVSRPKGVVIVKVALLMTVFMGCAALTVDMGQLYLARTELQRAADAAAMAGVQFLARSINNPFWFAAAPGNLLGSHRRAVLSRRFTEGGAE